VARRYITIIGDGATENREREKEGTRNGQPGAVNANGDKTNEGIWGDTFTLAP